MTFQPIVPLTGFAGWQFLNRTLDTQQTAFRESAGVTRLTDYFRENIGSVVTAEQLVEDRMLREVALGAFGLDADIDSRAFIQMILEEGTTEDDALANRLADSTYRTFSETFGFGDIFGPRTLLPDFADEIIARYEDRQFQIAVGNQDNDLRLALNLEGGLADLLESTTGEDARWFAIMGNTPLRTVFQTAMSLPSEVATLDIDRQLEIYKDRASSIFGTESVGDFTDPDRADDLIRLFLVRSEVAQFQATSTANVALTLLSNIPTQSSLFG